MYDSCRKVKYTLLVSLVKFLIWISSWLPARWLHAIFSTLSKVAFYLLKKERDKTIANVKIGYPDKTEKECRTFAREVFIYLGVNYADLAKGLTVRTQGHYRKVIQIEGEKHFEEAYKKGKGVLALTCHRGAFELVGTYCGLHYPTVGVGAKLKNKALDRLLVDNRTSRGIDFTHRGKNTLKLIRALKQGKVVIMLIDQDTDKVKNVFVDFYGEKAATPIGAALLAQKTGSAVVPMAMSIQNGKQVLTIRPKIEIVNTENEDEDIQTNTQLMSDALETFIKEHPEQWVWVHERWKTRPPSE